MIEIIMALQAIDDDDAKYRGLLADTIRARPPHIRGSQCVWEI
jgi:hypothetical protein